MKPDRAQEENIQKWMEQLSEVKAEIKVKKDEYEESVKDLKEMHKGLEALIKEEVMKRKESVTFGDLRAVYSAQVIIKKRKKDNGK